MLTRIRTGYGWDQVPKGSTTSRWMSSGVPTSPPTARSVNRAVFPRGLQHTAWTSPAIQERIFPRERKNAMEPAIQDPFGRQITYVRVSVTDRCNLKCVYCIPDGMEWVEKADVLSYEEMARLVRILAAMGVRKVRLTGGEPTVRPDLTTLVGLVRAIPGVEEISLSTNALLLAPMAAELRAAGLDRVNISLDTLRAERFREITRGGDIDKVLAGIAAAETAGLAPIKLNVVAMRGVTDDEIEEFARVTRERPWHVRFIEMMPLVGNAEAQPYRFLSSDEIHRRLSEIDALIPEAPPAGNGPATYFRYAG